jgi:hypothetical protein
MLVIGTQDQATGLQLRKSVAVLHTCMLSQQTTRGSSADSHAVWLVRSATGILGVQQGLATLSLPITPPHVGLLPSAKRAGGT